MNAVNDNNNNNNKKIDSTQFNWIFFCHCRNERPTRTKLNDQNFRKDRFFLCSIYTKENCCLFCSFIWKCCRLYMEINWKKNYNSYKIFLEQRREKNKLRATKQEKKISLFPPLSLSIISRLQLTKKNR